MTEAMLTHTFRRFEGELSQLHFIVADMGAVVLRQLDQALCAFNAADLDLAQQVIDGDAEVDALEAAGDALILQVISRNAPQASDLRRVITVSKSVTDLEKIGDEAVRVASLLHEMDGVSTSVPVTGLRKAMEEVGRRALDLLQEALGLFEVWDQRRALAVIEGQRQMDGQFQQALRHVMMRIQDERLDLGLAIRFVLVAKSMDRVAHHALNLAEYALFAEQGEDLRVLQPLDSTNRSAQES